MAIELSPAEIKNIIKNMEHEEWGYKVEYGKPQQSTGIVAADEDRATWEHADEAEALDKQNPFAFFVGSLFNQRIRAAQAWRVAWKLQQRLGDKPLTPETIANLSEQALYRLVRGRLNKQERCLHMNPVPMSKALRANAKMILKEYGGKTEAIWKTSKSIPELYQRLLAFKQIGDKIAWMMVKICAQVGAIPHLKDTGAIGLPVDVHVTRVLFRCGLAEAETKEAAKAAAEKWLPSNPWALDAAFSIGWNYCKPTNPRCDKSHMEGNGWCPLAYKKPMDDEGGGVLCRHFRENFETYEFFKDKYPEGG